MYNVLEPFYSLAHNIIIDDGRNHSTRYLDLPTRIPMVRNGSVPMSH